MIQAAIEHFDEQLLGVNVDFGAVKVTVGHSARNMKVTVMARRDGDTGDTIDDFKMIYYDHDDDDYDDDDDGADDLQQKNWGRKKTFKQTDQKDVI